MKSTKQLVIILFSFNCLLITTSVNATLGPGYVSRDCPAFGAKESITVDWTVKPHWFQTRSMHLFPKEDGGTYWLRYASDPKPGARGGWDETWRSYAGDFRNYRVNNFYSRVVGYHYWFNVNSRGIEIRTSDVQGCNATSWGSGNWEDGYTMKANFPSARNVYRAILTFF